MTHAFPTLRSSGLLAAKIEPAAQAGQNYDLVPKSSLSIHDRDVRHDQIEVGGVVVDVGTNGMDRVGIKRGFGAGLNLHSLVDIAVGRCRGWIKDQQSLAVSILRSDEETVGGQCCPLGGCCDDCGERIK